MVDGLKKGDRIAIVLPQSSEVIISLLATFRLGCISVPLSTHLEENVLRSRLAECGCKVIITDITNYEKIHQLRSSSSLRDLQLIIVVDNNNNHHHHRSDDTQKYAFASMMNLKSQPISSGGGNDNHVGSEMMRKICNNKDVVAWDMIINQRVTPKLQIENTTGDDAALIIYASSNKSSKPIIHTHRSMFAHIPGFELVNNYFPQTEEEDNEYSRVAFQSYYTPSDWSLSSTLMTSVLPSLYFGIPVIALPISPSPSSSLHINNHINNTAINSQLQSSNNNNDDSGGSNNNSGFFFSSPKHFRVRSDQHLKSENNRNNSLGGESDYSQLLSCLKQLSPSNLYLSFSDLQLLANQNFSSVIPNVCSVTTMVDRPSMIDKSLQDWCISTFGLPINEVR